MHGQKHKKDGYIVPLFLYLDTRRTRVVSYNYYKLDQLYAHTYNVLIYKTPTCFVGRSRNRFPTVSLGIFSVATDGCALGPTQPLKMSTRDFSWVKATGA